MKVPQRIQRLYVPLGLIFFIFSIVWILRTFFFQFYLVRGHSMAPALQEDDVLLVWKLGFPLPWKLWNWELEMGNPKIQRMDILVFENAQGELIVKRLIGQPGEYFEIDNGMVLINTQPLHEKYLPIGEKTEPGSILGERIPPPFLGMERSGQIPPNYYLFLGDNRDKSTDSRTLGLIPKRKLRGKVIYQF